jgi:transposase
MEHIGIDLGGRESQVCICTPEGEIVQEKKRATARLSFWLRGRPKSRVIMETCAEAFKLARQAREMGHQVRVVPGSLVRTLGVGSRGIKTDTRDARALSVASCQIDLPGVHIPEELSSTFKSMCGMRESLVTSRTKLINCTRGWLRTHIIHIRSGGAGTFVDRVRERLMELSMPVPCFVDSQLTMLATLTVQINASDRDLKQVAKTHPVCSLLMTVPGVGPVTAVRYVAAVDDVTRFKTASQIQSYFGLTPGERSSSSRVKRTSITKAGSSEVRFTLVQAAWSAFLRRPNDPVVRWAHRIAERRGRRIAVVALARKLSGILFAMWRDGKPYAAETAADIFEPMAKAA